MNMVISIILFIVGLGLVIHFAEKLVKGVIGTSIGFGITALLTPMKFNQVQKQIWGVKPSC